MSTRTPSRTEVESFRWLVSPRIWLTTVVMMGVFVVLVGVTGRGLYDVPVMTGIRRSVTTPVAVLYILLFSRAFAFVLAQRRRDAAMRSGELSVGNEASLMGMTTVAAFSVVGVLAAGVAMPLLVTVRQTFTYLAIGLSVLVVPISFLLLVYQLGQRTAADRYERGFHVVPAIWHYLWTLPLVVLAWYLALNVPPIPVSGAPARLFDVRRVFVDAWTFGYAAICTPTLLAFLYPVRWYVERFLRIVSPR